MSYTYDDVAAVTALAPNMLIRQGVISRELRSIGIAPTPRGHTGGGGKPKRHELSPRELLALSVVLGIEDMDKSHRRIIARRIITGLIGRYIILVDGEECVSAQTLPHMLQTVQKLSERGVLAIVDLVRMAKTDEGRALVEQAIAETRCA